MQALGLVNDRLQFQCDPLLRFRDLLKVSLALAGDVSLEGYHPGGKGAVLWIHVAL